MSTFTRILSVSFMLCGSMAAKAQDGVTNKVSPFTQMVQVRREEFFKHTPTDACSELLRRVEKKEVSLDTTSRLTLTKGLLDALNVPVSSQLLVFSGTASQGAKVSSRNPRAIYFNDEVYVGLVPNGFVEMIGVDPQFGPVWYSIERIVKGEAPVALRSTDCFRCHNTGSGGVPAMFTRFVIPNEAQGRISFSVNSPAEGHHITFASRFAGYHVTSIAPLSYNKEGLIMLPNSKGEPELRHITVGQRYDPKLHLTTTSDIAAHLVHAHQVGFVNLAAQLNTYARDGRINSPNLSSPSGEHLALLADNLVRYILFAEEAPLPVGGVTGHPEYLKAFAANRKPSKEGHALKDFDLQTRMFKYRCSYMIYTRQWQEMPAVAKAVVYAKLRLALWGKDPYFTYLPESERQAIISILRDTLPDLPFDWRS